MAQNDLVINNQSFPSFRSDLNSALQAIQTTHSGTSRPTGAVAGQIWLDTTNSTSPTLKFFDGSDDISLATINYTANTVDWLDSSVTITGLSTTATGTVLTLSDTASTSSVNLIIDNQKEVRFRETTANGTNYVALKAPASLASDVTFTLPSTDGTANQVLQTNGSGVLSFATVGGLAWQSIVTASTLTAVAGRGYWIDTTSNACTVTLPASATNGDTIILADYARKWGTNAVTINTNSLNFQGYTSPNPIYNTSGQSVTLVYSGATQGWIPTVDDDVTNETPQSYNIEYLVVGGGGAGGSDSNGSNNSSGGGGGAGGFRTGTYSSVTPATVLTCTVGAGGSGATLTNGGSGTASSITATGLTTISSAGGGGGGREASNGLSGGSGGGGGYGNDGPNGNGGSGNTPSTSPSQGNNGGNAVSSNHAGGGGGASNAGVNGGSGSQGGNGTASSITGSSVTYAGGGGGGEGSTGSNYPAGGTGGGGRGGAGTGTNGLGDEGTDGLGGGGGGNGAGSQNTTVGLAGRSGGDGVVILSVPTANYSATTTGSPTITTSGSNTIIKFTSTGTYTA